MSKILWDQKWYWPFPFCRGGDMREIHNLVKHGETAKRGTLGGHSHARGEIFLLLVYSFNSQKQRQRQRQWQWEALSTDIAMPEVNYQTMIRFVLWLVAFFGEFWIGVFQLPWKQPFIIACISFTFIHCILFLCVIFSWVNSENKFSGGRRERSKADKRREQHKQQHGQLQKVKVIINKT